MITYRKATTDDIPELVKLRVDFLREVTNSENWGNDFIESLGLYFNEHLEQGDYVSWLAIDDGTIVANGGISFYSHAPTFNNISGNRAHILNVYTLPEHRRQGIAKQLFEKLMQEGMDRGVNYISLHATEDGRPLYEKYGFKKKDTEMVWMQ